MLYPFEMSHFVNLRIRAYAEVRDDQHRQFGKISENVNLKKRHKVKNAMI
jgi:hypothetical protein